MDTGTAIDLNEQRDYLLKSRAAHLVEMLYQTPPLDRTAKISPLDSDEPLLDNAMFGALITKPPLGYRHYMRCGRTLYILVLGYSADEFGVEVGYITAENEWKGVRQTRSDLRRDEVAAEIRHHLVREVPNRTAG